MGFFERTLSLWVLVSIVVGIAMGRSFPNVFQGIGEMSVDRVNIPVALLIWIMIVPMLMRIDFRTLGEVGREWKGIGVTVFVNWAVKPFSMAFLAWLLVRHAFLPWLPAAHSGEYVAGLILLAAAPCTAMVFVWSHLVHGDPRFTLTQVALNDALMVVLFAPIVGLLLGMSSIPVPWGTLGTSVILYIAIPVVIAQAARFYALSKGPDAFGRCLALLHPASIGALLATLILLFSFQGVQILKQPKVIGILSIVILIQVFVNAGIAYTLDRALGVPHQVAGPSALIGASNFFELAVAVAIGVFGFRSGAALATVVGVLVEVPVMLSLVSFINRTRSWYERGQNTVPAVEA
jgi:ACR3 family arsenite transporter